MNLFPTTHQEIGGCALCLRAPECLPGAQICRDCIVAAGTLCDAVTGEGVRKVATDLLIRTLRALVAEALIAAERGHTWTTAQRERCRAVLEGLEFEVVGVGQGAEYKNGPEARRL